MLKAVDASAQLNRWRQRTGPIGLFCVGMMVCTFLPPSRSAAILTGAVTVATTLMGANVPVGTFLRALAAPLTFVAVGWLALSFSVELQGPWPTLRLAPEGVPVAIDSALRSIAATSVLVCFACTVPASRWISWLARLGLPVAIIDLLYLTYRTIFILDEERQSLLLAARQRLGNRTPAACLRTAGHLGAGLLVRTLGRAHRLHRGLEARCFHGHLRVLQSTTSSHPADYALALAVPLACGAALLLLGRSS